MDSRQLTPLRYIQSKTALAIRARCPRQMLCNGFTCRVAPARRIVHRRHIARRQQLVGAAFAEVAGDVYVCRLERSDWPAKLPEGFSDNGHARRLISEQVRADVIYRRR